MLLGLAFPAPDLWPLVWVALVPLLVVVEDVSSWQGWWLGLTAGAAYRLLTLYWLPGAIARHGDLSLLLATATALALILFLATFVGWFAAVAAWLLPAGPGMVLVLGALWVVLEWVQSWILGGFPWGFVGYPAGRPLPMMQVADLAGVYGLSFLAVFFNGALAVTLRQRPGGRAVAAVATGLVALATVYGVVRLAGASAAERPVARVPGSPPGTEELETLLEPLRVALVQGNVAPDRERDPAAADRILLDHLRLTRQGIAERADLVIWPESSVPAPRGFARDPTIRRSLAGLARSTGVSLLVGTAHPAGGTGERAFTNSAFLVTPDGEWSRRYDKVRLVPFAEYVPGSRWLQLPGLPGPLGGTMTEYRSGSPEQPLLEAVSDGVPPFGTAICYEIVFPSLVRRQVREGATFLATITNDGWFGDTSAPYQHFEMARFRAVEMRRWLVRAANTGISGVVDPWGRVHRRLGVDEEGVLVATIVPRSDMSPYALRGDLFVLVCVLLVGATFWMCSRGSLTRPEPVEPA